jgi:hypothetical protein
MILSARFAAVTLFDATTVPRFQKRQMGLNSQVLLFWLI